MPAALCFFFYLFLHKILVLSIESLNWVIFILNFLCTCASNLFVYCIFFKYVIIVPVVAAHNPILRPSHPRRGGAEAGSSSLEPSAGRQSDVGRIVCV